MATKAIRGDVMRGDVVTVRWVCRASVWKQIKGRRGRVRLSCGNAFTAIIARLEYDAREARARCPSCGGLLTQQADGCEVVSDR